MKVTINKEGEFVIVPENEQEIYLLKCWKKDNRWGEEITSGCPVINIKL